MLTDSERALLRKVLNMLMDLLSTEEASPPALDSEEAAMVDVPTAAKRLGVSTSFVYRAVRTGKLAAHRIGSTIRFYPADIEAYIRANEREANPMKRCLVLALLSVPLLAACAGRETQKVTPGSRVIYHGGKFAVFTICDRGNRVYMTEDSDQVTVIPGGCPDGQP